jgi:hypothetical protein
MQVDEERLNISLRSFLKRVGINSQRHIENAVRAGAESGQLPAKLAVKVTLDLAGCEDSLVIEGEIETRSE